MVALRKTQPAPRLTVAQFLKWPDDPTGQLWQLVDGVLVAMAPASRTHGAILSQVARLLGNHLEASHSPCTVISNPGVVPRVLADRNARIPDVAVTCSPDTDADPLLRDPVLVIEILSPSNEEETWSNVWAYTTIGSVAEILILHSQELKGEFLRRGADGLWPENPLELRGTDEISLESIGGAFPLRAFYATTRLGREQD